MVKIAGRALLLLVLTFFVGCGGGNDTGRQANPSITISPTTGTIKAGESVTLTVTVQDTSITWPTTVPGTFTRSNNTANWTPPKSAGTYEFTVTSPAGVSATARITVVWPDPTITVHPGNVSIDEGSSFLFLAEVVTLEGQPAPAVTWESSGDCGTMDEDGRFQAVSEGTCSVTATIHGGDGKAISSAAEVTVRESSYILIDHPTSIHTYVTGINGSGMIVGTYSGYDMKHRGFLKNGDNWEIIEYPGASATYVDVVSDSGLVAGSFDDADGLIHGFVKSDDGYELVDHPDSDETGVWDIDDSGRMAGYFYDLVQDRYRGFVKEGEDWKHVDYPEAAHTFVTWMGDGGLIIGYYIDDEDSYHGFVRDAAGYRTVDHPASGYTELWGADATGRITGNHIDAEGRWNGFVKNGDVWEVVGYPAADATYVSGISASGRVVGYFVDTDGSYHGFMK